MTHPPPLPHELWTHVAAPLVRAVLVELRFGLSNVVLHPPRVPMGDVLRTAAWMLGGSPGARREEAWEQAWTRLLDAGPVEGPLGHEVRTVPELMERVFEPHLVAPMALRGDAPEDVFAGQLLHNFQEAWTKELRWRSERDRARWEGYGMHGLAEDFKEQGSSPHLMIDDTLRPVVRAARPDAPATVLCFVEAARGLLPDHPEPWQQELAESLRYAIDSTRGFHARFLSFLAMTQAEYDSVSHTGASSAVSTLLSRHTQVLRLPGP